MMGAYHNKSSDGHLVPIEIKVKKSSGCLDISWANGEVSSISHKCLRQHCACSHCRARRRTSISMVHVDTTISNIELMGSTGLQVIFSDGHDKGIFPWAYLRAIAEGNAESFIENAGAGQS